jgi:hypothetical protein
VEGLTGSEIALVRRSGRSQWSRRGTGRRGRWSESAGPCAQAGEFVGGEYRPAHGEIVQLVGLGGFTK